MSEDLHESPWTEEQWQRFFRQSDVRSAKFGELLETFIDDPNCEEIIAKEMRWDTDAEEGEESEESDNDFDAAEILEAASQMTDEEMKEIEREEKRALQAIPAYGKAQRFSRKVDNALKELMAKEEDGDEDIGIAWINAHIIVAKLVGANAMGYDDDVLCGNIVKCKDVLAAAAECHEALNRLKERKVLPVSVLNPLIAECQKVKAAVEDHIADMRSRVWWQSK